MKFGENRAIENKSRNQKRKKFGRKFSLSSEERAEKKRKKFTPFSIEITLFSIGILNIWPRFFGIFSISARNNTELEEKRISIDGLTIHAFNIKDLMNNDMKLSQGINV